MKVIVKVPQKYNILSKLLNIYIMQFHLNVLFSKPSYSSVLKPKQTRNLVWNLVDFVFKTLSSFAFFFSVLDIFSFLFLFSVFVFLFFSFLDLLFLLSCFFIFTTLLLDTIISSAK